MIHCPTREQFRRLLNDEVEDSDRQTLEEHVEKCDSCSQLLEDLCRPSAARTETIDAVTPNGPRYRPLRWHAKGGLGEIFIAQDQELQREVALKEMQGVFAHDEKRRQRFVLEAKVTGLLEHPGIVPVYGLGAYADGRPYYAMRFVRGETLKEAIRGYHQAAGDGRKFRQLLGSFGVVCNTVAYAHSRGVLHRDLKPENIIQGEYGETLVCDWGLVKAIGEGEGGSPPTKALHTALGIETLNTETGKAIGTPPYMSPEQAAGQMDKLTPASDIYSLGATLYELLTGEAPFRSSDTGDILERVKAGQVRSPLEVKPGIPADLAAVCLKAMALQPQDRYPTALDLAADIERWMADEPTSARPEPWSEKCRRWVSRHRTMVTSALAVSVVTSLILIVANIWLQAAAERERQAKETALQKEREASEQRDQTAIAISNLARLTGERSSSSEAIKLYQQGLDMVEQQARNNPTVAKYQAELARYHSNLGLLHTTRGESGQAEKAYDNAIVILEQLASENQTVKQYQSDLARNHVNLGVLYGELKQPEKAERAYNKAGEAYGRLAALEPSNPEFQNGLAANHNNLGMLFQNSGQLNKAEQAYKKSLSLREDLAARHPSVPDYRADLAAVYNNLGSLLDVKKQPAEAVRATRKAFDTYSELVAKHRNVSEYARNLGVTSVNLGDFFRNQGDNGAALEWYTKAVRTLAAVLRQTEGDQFAQDALRVAHEGEAQSLTHLGRHEEAQAEWDEALRLATGQAHDRLRIARASTLARLGQHAQATAEAKGITERPEVSDEITFAGAGTFALAAAGVQKDAKLAPGERNKLRKQYSVRSVEMLRKVLKAGYFKTAANFEALKTGHDFDAIRADREFVQLMEQAGK